MLDRISLIVAASIETKRQFFAEHAGEVVSAAQIIADCFRHNRKLLLCGNGGSAADAQHIAGEFINRFLRAERRALPALALSTDGGVLTCIANDTSFDQIFARQIEAFGEAGDVLLAISTSGNSSNIIAGIEAARGAKMKTIGLLGRDGGRVAPLCDLALVVRSLDTQRIQETHNLIGHVICETVEEILFGEEG
jgi:D-sedoheptulose 7-phosphate isomerase